MTTTKDLAEALRAALKVLREIHAQDAIELALDPQWAQRMARSEITNCERALASHDAAQSAGEAQPDLLAEMEARKDAAYLERNQVVAALAKAFPSGVARTAIEGWSKDWHGVVYIDLPTGQASWHFHDSQAYLFDGLPPYAGKWDGHTTEEKYARLAALKAGEAPVPVARYVDEGGVEWVTVPVEPTVAMMDGAFENISLSAAHTTYGVDQHVWAHMIERAPKPPAAPPSPAVERDAERYRWLRDDEEWAFFDSEWLVKHDLYGQGSDSLDEFIDAAMGLPAQH